MFTICEVYFYYCKSIILYLIFARHSRRKRRASLWIRRDEAMFQTRFDISMKFAAFWMDSLRSAVRWCVDTGKRDWSTWGPTRSPGLHRYWTSAEIMQSFGRWSQSGMKIKCIRCVVLRMFLFCAPCHTNQSKVSIMITPIIGNHIPSSGTSIKPSSPSGISMILQAACDNWGDEAELVWPFKFCTAYKATLLDWVLLDLEIGFLGERFGMTWWPDR